MQLKKTTLIAMTTGLGLACGANAQAALFANVILDTPTDLIIEWDWNEFDVNGLQVNDFDIPVLANWDVLLSTFFVPLVPPPVGSWQVDIDASHLTDPHPSDVGGGVPVLLTTIFDDTAFLGAIVLPGAAATVFHPTAHSDSYTMEVFHSVGGANNIIRLIGVHVPSPGALSLLALSSLIAIRRRR